MSGQPPTPLDSTAYATELAAEFVERTSIAPEQLGKMWTADVGHTDSEVVYEENKLEVRRYEPEEVTQDTPLVLVYALINKPYVVDLQPQMSLVKTLLDAGFELYLVDWGDPSLLDRSLTLEDYVCRYLDNAIEEICELTDVDDVHVLGYCIGGTLSVMYAALNPERVRTLGTMALAFDFSEPRSVYDHWTEGMPIDLMADTMANMPKRPMAVTFKMKEPVTATIGQFVELYEGLEDDAFMETVGRTGRWSWDGVDIAGETFRQLFGEIFQENRLAANDFYLGERHVDLSNVDMPVVQVMGEYDTIVPPACSKPLEGQIASEDYREVVVPNGHIGLSISPTAHAEYWPQVTDWYAERGRGDDDNTEDEATVPGGTTAQTANGHDADESLESIDGIGPTYADRLADAGFQSPTDLVDADAEELADAAETSPSRAADWLDQVA